VRLQVWPEGGALMDNGTFCGDKRIGRVLCGLVTQAAWLLNLGRRD
jgi:hypothetical protein